MPSSDVVFTSTGGGLGGVGEWGEVCGGGGGVGWVGRVEWSWGGVEWGV